MKFRSIYLWCAAALLLLGLAGLAYLGTFTRFHGDDFCMAADAAQIGLAGMLAKWYTAWTGRFMFILGTGIFGLAGPGFAGWLPALAEAAWLAGLAWAVLPLIRKAGWPHPRLLAVISGAFGLMVLLSSLPNPFQSFYWQDGFVNYSLPLIGLTFSGGMILRAWLHPTRTWVPAVGAFFLAFLSGGFTEALAALQVALFVLALCAALILGNRTHRHSLLPVLAAALAGGLLAMLIVVIAPGNQVRLGTVGDHPGLVRIITFSMRNAAFIFGKFFIETPFWGLSAVGLPFLAGWYFSAPGTGASDDLRSSPGWRGSWPVRLVLLGLSAFALVTAACAPVVYAINAYPDDRTIIIPQLIVVAAVITGSAWLGTGARRSKIVPDPAQRPAVARALRVGMAAAVILAVGWSTWQTAAQAPEFQAYARAWDQRAVAIQQAAEAGLDDVTVAGLNARFGVADLNEDPDHWVNRCMAYYYGIRTLRGR